MIHLNLKKRYAKTCLFFCSMLFLVAIIGCSHYVRYYFYDGDPRSYANVATIVFHSNLMLISLNNTPLAKFSKTYDIAPGEYTLDIFYSDTTDSRSKTYIYSGRDILKLSTKAGYIYYIYPSFPSKGKWQLTLVDFDSQDKLSKYKPGFWSLIDTGNDIRKKVDRHFQAKNRHSLRVSEHKHWE